MLKKLSTGLFLLCFTFISSAQDDSDSDTDKAENTKRPSWSAGLPERQKQADLNTPSFKPDMDNEIELDMSEFGLQEKPQISIELPINEDLPIKEESLAEEAPVKVVEQVETNDLNSEPDDAVVQQPVLDVAEQQPTEVPVDVTEETAIVEQPVAEPVVLEPVVEQPPVEEAIVESVPDSNDAAVQSEAQVEEQVAEQAVDDSVNESVQEQATIDQSIASVSQPIELIEPNNIEEAAEEQIQYNWDILKREPVSYPVRAAIDNLEGWVEVEVTIDPTGKVVSASPIKYSRKGRVFGKPAVQSVQNWLFSPPSEIGITENLTRVYKVEFDL